MNNYALENMFKYKSPNKNYFNTNKKPFHFYKNFKKEKSAVSEALGTIMLLAIAMALIGLVYYWVASLPTPEEDIRVELKANMEMVSGQRVVIVEHTGGEALDIYQYEIYIKLNDINQRSYQVSDSNAAVFSNGYWEVGETWQKNINTIHDWNASIPIVKLEVRDIGAQGIIYSQELRLSGEGGNLPDLIIDEKDIGFHHLNATLKPFEWVNITARVRNIGDSDAVNVIVRFFEGSEIISRNNKDYIYTPSITIGSSQIVWINWTPIYSGARTIHVKVYSSQIEKNFANNFASKKLEIEPIIPEISGPNLEIESISFSPETPTHGDWVTISVLVKNVGDEDIPTGSSINISLWDDNGYLLTRGVFYNFSRTITSELTIFETLLPAFIHNSQTTFGGTTTIWAEVSTNVIESQYNDNRLYAHIQILPTILLIDDDGIFERYSQDDTSSYMDTALQLAVGSGQFDILTIKGLLGPKYASGDKPLMNYDIVIWCTGYQTSNTLTASDRNEIKTYLDNQGKIWIVGMNILPDISGSGAFIYDYLGVENFNETGTPQFLYGVTGDNLTAGMQLNTSNLIKSQDHGVNLTVRSSDYVNHTVDGILGNDDFFGQNGNMSLKYHNITNDFKVVYFSWEFAAINNMVDRNNLTIHILKWFGWELEIGTDLAISSKGFDNENPDFMDWITITARIRNNGPRDLAGVRVDFFIIDDKGIEKRIPEYPGFEDIDNPQFIYMPGEGKEREVHKKWLATSVGQHTFKVVVDLEDDIEELSEENNDDFYSPLFVTQLYIGYTILLVDDDNSTNNGGIHPNATNEIAVALDELGYIYNTYVASGGVSPTPGPNITVMKHYNTVIWCTGYDGNYTLLSQDQEHLSNYLTRSNFSEADFLGDTKYNAWIVGQGILNDLGGSGNDIVPPTNSFIYNYLKVKKYSTMTSKLPRVLNGVYRDNITHGLQYPMISSALDETDTITPTNDAKGIFWHNNIQTLFNTIRFNNSIQNLVFTPWVYSLINDTTTAKYVNESYKDEMCYLILRWFQYPIQRFELKTSEIDIKLSNYDPVLGNSYVIKTNVYNLGRNDTNAIVRFLDGDSIINIKSIFVPKNGNSSTEVIWTPLYAGYRNLRIVVDPSNDIDEVFDFLNNDATLRNQVVYFFYDDLENGTTNWKHDSTIVSISGESPIEFVDMPVYSRIENQWNRSMTHNFILNSTTYHSYSSSYFTLEPKGLPKKVALDIVLALDNSGSMNGQPMADLIIAAKNFVNHPLLDSRDRMAIYAFDNEAPSREQDFTSCNTTGKDSLVSTIDNLVAGGFTPIWDTIGASVNYAISAGSSRIPIVIAMTDGEDMGDGGAGEEDGSETYCPWHNWSDGEKTYHDLDSSNGHDHYGCYGGSAVAEGGWGWENIQDETRYGLLNITDMKVYTVGLGLEHDNHTGDNTWRFPNGWMGEYAEYSLGSGYNISIYDESGTSEFNLWRVANTSGGEYFYAQQSSQLNSIFQSIAADLVEETTVDRRPRDQLWFDGFESGDFTGGPWNNGPHWGTSTSGEHSGNYHAYCYDDVTDSSLALNSDIDLTNYEDVKLIFWLRDDRTENTDYFYIDVSVNSGVTWTNIRTFDGDQVPNTYTEYQIDLSAYDGELDFRFRFRATVNGWNEWFFVDDIEVQGNVTQSGGEEEPQDLSDLYEYGDRNLTTETFSLRNITSAKLSFYHKFNMRNGLNGIVVMVGTPTDTTGANWSFEYVRPTQPYNGNIYVGTRRTDDFNNEMRWCWNGISGYGRYTWDFVEVDLTNWTGLNEVRVKIAFLWVGPGDGGAYYIDDFKVKVTRNETQALSEHSVDQWEYIDTGGHSGDHCWWNHNKTTNHLTGGLDNSLYTRLIDLTNARNATLSAYFKFNINTGSGRPPDGFRVEISSDNGVTWRAINLGVRTAWGVSTNGTDSDDGMNNDGKSYSGLDVYRDDQVQDGWIEANTLTRLNTDITGWAGSVIILRFRVVTASDNNPYFGSRHYQWKSPTNNAYGFMIDDVIIYGYSLAE